MESYEELNQVKSEYEFSQFCGLCDRAKAYLFDWLVSGNNDGVYSAVYDCGVINAKRTPIEQIFEICYHRYIDTYLKGQKIWNIPIDIALQMELSAQEEIECEKHHYVADFVIDFSRANDKDQPMYPAFNKLKYVIELDGFEYHSNKKQVNYDYEREQQLQMAGYKVIRFTGSQIFNKPYFCIHKLLTIILNDISEAKENGNI